MNRLRLLAFAGLAACAGSGAPLPAAPPPAPSDAGAPPSLVARFDPENPWFETTLGPGSAVVPTNPAAHDWVGALRDVACAAALGDPPAGAPCVVTASKDLPSAGPEARHRVKLEIHATDGMNTWSLAASMFLEGDAETRDGVLVGAKLHGHVHLKKIAQPTGATLEEGDPLVSLTVERR